MSRLWPAGAQVMLRHTLEGRTWALVPVTVLQDTAVATVVRISAGSRYLAPVDEQGRLLRLGPSRWWLRPRTWNSHDVLYLLTHGRWFAVGLLVRPGTAQSSGWYLNFQTAPQRTTWGIDTLDLELDMVAPAGRDEAPAWRLKDAARFRALVAAGFFSKAQMRHTVAALRGIRASDTLRRERGKLLRLSQRLGPAADLASAVRFCGTLPPDVPAAYLPGAPTAPPPARRPDHLPDQWEVSLC